ncbi:hypothetical protein SASPL_104912 [Salvia splendens]|uniref:Prephenate/arogenate dehydrogenase domain-containing protein n=1 Tax=Salvia splendens TaxID=180675 RepID=A0A8X9AB44_SALSN|nr:hypothetical protein SASPL_104912 [Salvia splendens]
MSSTKSLRIGMIGFGPFAQFLAKTMIRQGHIITATSRSDYTHLCTQLGISFFRHIYIYITIDDILLERDIIDVLSSITSLPDSRNALTSLHINYVSLSQVIKALPLECLKQPMLFVDVLSVKEHPRDLMLQVLPHDSDPMFGPESGKNGWKDLPFMFDKVRIRNEAACSDFLQIFATEGCKMMEMSCEEDDEFSGRSQFLTHTLGRSSQHQGVSEASSSGTVVNMFSVLALLCNGYDFSSSYSTIWVQLRNLELALASIKLKLESRGEEQEQS